MSSNNTEMSLYEFLENPESVEFPKSEPFNQKFQKFEEKN